MMKPTNIFETAIAGVKFPSLIMNASGPRCKSINELNKLLDSASGAVVTKSMTLECRNGNVTPKYVAGKHFTVNANGLENFGFQCYLDWFESLEKLRTKPIVASIAGIVLTENMDMIARLQDSKNQIDLVELNVSCPNIGGTPIVYDPVGFVAYLTAVKTVCDGTIPIGLKLPVYRPHEIPAIAEIILNAGFIKFVTCCNSLPGATPITNNRLEILPNNGAGGYGGKALKDFAITNVMAFHKLFREQIDIIGVGGVFNHDDVIDYVMCGAKAVQVGSAFSIEGNEIFNRINYNIGEFHYNTNYTKGQPLLSIIDYYYETIEDTHGNKVYAK
jgi:dihydroorotate dehydrogenase (fumarate)